MAGLKVLKKCGKIQNVVSSSDFEIFSPEMHALVLVLLVLLCTAVLRQAALSKR